MRITFRFLFAVLLLSGCADDPIDKDSSSNEPIEPIEIETPDWQEATHSNDADPDYSKVFLQNEVNRMDITMTAEDWSAIQSDMLSLYGFAFGSGEKKGGGFPDNEPAYVAVSVKMNDLEWYKVGFRLKGNSSLSKSWGNGIYKLPFRLNLDKFEDTYPAIKNQRFYGFKELSFSPGANDNSLIREKLATDIFRKAGIPAPQTSFYRVYINFGGGSKYCGVYTVIEVVEDTMVKEQFGEDEGNIYKPESYLKTYTQSEFEKKNNKDLNDYSDVQALIGALNSNLRSSNPTQWRANLEAAFNVSHFLKWLAVNTTMTNWDTYGAMAHNYYLYNHPSNKLTWIPWDNNESFSERSSAPSGSSVTLSLSSVTSSWPLIRYLADDPEYYAQYKKYVREFADTAFETSDVHAMMDQYHTLISPYVIGPDATESGKYTQLTSSASFTSELNTLKQLVTSRQSAVNSFVPK